MPLWVTKVEGRFGGGGGTERDRNVREPSVMRAKKGYAAWGTLTPVREGSQQLVLSLTPGLSRAMIRNSPAFSHRGSGAISKRMASKVHSCLPFSLRRGK